MIADVSVLPMDRHIVLSFQTVTIAGIRIGSVVRWRRPARHVEQGLNSDFWIDGAPSMFRQLFSLGSMTRRALAELHTAVESAAHEA